MTVVGVVVGMLGGAAYLSWVRRSRLNEERRLAIGLVVAALIYVGFAVVGGTGLAQIGIELGGVVAFGGIAVVALGKRIEWFALGWGLHVLWDVVLHSPEMSFVPAWYPIACVAFDAMVAGYALARSDAG